MALAVKIPKNVFDSGRKAFKENPSGYQENVELTPGRHVAIITNGRAVQTDKGPQIVFDCKIAGESEQAGGRVSIWFSMLEDRIIYLFKCLALLGYEVDDMDEKMLEEMLNDIKDTRPVVRLTAKQNGEYVNVYIDKKLDDVEATEAGGESAADTDAGGGKAGVKSGAHAKADELVELDRAALKQLVEDEEVDIAIKKSTTEDEIRDAIRAHRKDNPEAEEAKAEEKEEAEDDLAEKTRAELKEILEEEEIDFSVKKATTEEEIIEAIREARAAKEGGKDEKEEAPSQADESVELEIGMGVKAKIKGKMMEAKVVSIDEKKGEVKVKTKDGGLHKVSADDLELKD